MRAPFHKGYSRIKTREKNYTEIQEEEKTSDSESTAQSCRLRSGQNRSQQAVNGSTKIAAIYVIIWGLASNENRHSALRLGQAWLSPCRCEWHRDVQTGCRCSVTQLPSLEAGVRLSSELQVCVCACRYAKFTTPNHQTPHVRG